MKGEGRFWADYDSDANRRMCIERSRLFLTGLKAAKEKAGYKEGMNHCGKCIYWDAGDSCQIVEGEIDADDGCRFYKEANS